MIRLLAGELTALAGQLKPQQLAPVHVEALLDRWRKHLAPSTTHRKRNRLQRLVRAINPGLAVPRIRRPPPRTTIATSEEIAHLLAAAQLWMRCLLTLCTLLGPCLREALRCGPAGFDPEHHTITAAHTNKCPPPKTSRPCSTPRPSR